VYQPYGAVYSPQTLWLVNICTAWSRHAFSCIMKTTYYRCPHCSLLLSAGKWCDGNWMNCGNTVVVVCVLWLIVHVHVTLTVGIERRWFVRCGFLCVYMQTKSVETGYGLCLVVSSVCLQHELRYKQWYHNLTNLWR
jgi:hypothetical protein